MFTRRDFIKGAAVLGGLVLTPLQKLIQRRTQRVFEPPPPEGELYAGFLLLPDGARAPDFVVYPPSGIPVLCGVGDSPGPTAVWHTFETPRQLRAAVRFPLYDFSGLPARFRRSSGYMIEHRSGEVFLAGTEYHSYTSAAVIWETRLALLAQPSFPRPFPLWSSEPVEAGDMGVTLEKVDFLPTPGIQVTTPSGFVFHWIKQDILYTLVAEYGEHLDEARALIETMALVQ